MTMNTTDDKRSTQDTSHTEQKELTLDDLEAVSGGLKYVKSVYDGLSVEDPGRVDLP
jgi:hypothetical protein